MAETHQKFATCLTAHSHKGHLQPIALVNTSILTKLKTPVIPLEPNCPADSSIICCLIQQPLKKNGGMENMDMFRRNTVTINSAVKTMGACDIQISEET